ncbi:MAG: hypothetical protein GXP61_00475 [Epsilonproteobacteria bacterium]|nr:hypothetical protein [Campylobacterota bacterium]
MSSVKIKYKEIEESLKSVYNSYKESIENANIDDNRDSIYLKGFCYVLEKVLEVYGKKDIAEIEAIKVPILGKISMGVRQKENLDKPTYLRKGIDIKAHHKKT